MGRHARLPVNRVRKCGFEARLVWLEELKMQFEEQA